MASFYYGGHPHQLNSHSPASGVSHNNHHGGRSRRAPRLAGQHNPKHLNRNARQLKDAPVPEAPAAIAFRREFEAARSFDLEDDEMFCPFSLWTEDDLQSIHSSGSDRSSLSSGSPESSPLQPQVQPSGPFSLTPAAHPQHMAAGPFHHHQPQHHMPHVQPMKLHAPLAQRTRNAIPIVDPSTHRNVSPPPSVSPARQLQHHQQHLQRRW